MPITRLEIDSPSAGKLARIRWVLDADGGNAGRGALLSLAITHIEKKMTVFAVDKIPVEGEFSMNFHFVDGAEHRVSARGGIARGESDAFRTSRVGLRSRTTSFGDAAGVGAFFDDDSLGIGCGKMEPLSCDPILIHSPLGRCVYASETSINTPSGSDI